MSYRWSIIAACWLMQYEWEARAESCPMQLWWLRHRQGGGSGWPTFGRPRTTPPPHWWRHCWSVSRAPGRC